MLRPTGTRGRRALLTWVALASMGCAGSSTPPADARSTALPTSSLRAAGLSEVHWQAAVSEIAARDLAIDAMTLVVDGAVVAERYRAPHARNTLHDMRSTTKSITSLLVGIAIDRGLIAGVDTEIAPLFPEYTPHPSWQTLPPITIGDLLTMRSGLDCDDWVLTSPGHEDVMYKSDDWLAFFFSVPAIEPPGKSFRYCTAGVVVLGEIVARSFGRRLPQAADEWLFAPLGIAEARWKAAPHDVTDAGGHIDLSVESLIKIGLLAAGHGVYSGRRVVSEGYVREMLTPRASVGPASAPGPRYGYLWWLEPVEGNVVRSFQTRGNGGQYAIALPEFNAIVGFTGSAHNDTAKTLAPFDLTMRYLIPMLKERTVASSDD